MSSNNIHNDVNANLGRDPGVDNINVSWTDEELNAMFPIDFNVPAPLPPVPNNARAANPFGNGIEAPFNPGPANGMC